MRETHDYLVPEYYPKFACKMGACRSACCEGWPISISMKDYFRLLGVECGQDLRHRIDCAMHLTSSPSPDRYAQILPGYNGDCPLRANDGKCMVHAELGEEALALVCRLYPRGPRTEGCYECSCSCSCEAVLEELFQYENPLRFIEMTLSMDLPPEPERAVHFETMGREQEIRMWMINRMQNRSLPMPLRLLSFGRDLSYMERALGDKDAHMVQALLSGAMPKYEAPEPGRIYDRLMFGLKVASGMVDMLDKNSSSIRDYGESALEYFGNGREALARYERARAHFRSVIPDWQARFEHMLVNHMFFQRFPFQDRPENMREEFLALCSVYALLRFLGLGYMAGRDKQSDFTDVAAAAFRLIDHTGFDRYAGRLLRDLGCEDDKQVLELVLL